MEIEIKKFLYDIHESIDSIEKYLGNIKDFIIYMTEKMLRRAVEREFEIIGEAISRIENLILLLIYPVKTNNQYAQ
jgi:uncharacterized protein with HEPN domain